MKVVEECVNCIYDKGLSVFLSEIENKEFNRSEKDEKRKIAEELLQNLLETCLNDTRMKTYPKHSLNPAYITTLRSYILNHLFGGDLLLNVKINAFYASINVAKILWEQSKEIQEVERQIKTLLLAATAANGIEFNYEGEVAIATESFVNSLVKNAEQNVSPQYRPFLDQLTNDIMEANHILYLVDNVGELTFDCLLIKKLVELGKKVTTAAKKKPILNDATTEDVNRSYITLFGDVDPNISIIHTGIPTVGLFPGFISKEFWNAFDSADLILAKGMGHYESLPLFHWKKPIWILFQAKCSPIAKETKSELRELIFFYLKSNFKERRKITPKEK